MKKNVIITGASGNLGGACVQRFANDGYQVIAVVPPGDKLRFDAPQNVAVVEADLLNEKSSEEFVGTVIRKHGTIDAALTFTEPASGTVTAGFELVRNIAKREAPLLALVSNGNILSTVADVSFFGRDQAGNDISAAGSITVNFGNFADRE